jgi:integrase
MSEANSTPPASGSKPAKPAKPYPEFPLTAHPAGQWCKKIRGKLHYFGPWSDPDEALRKYDAEKESLHAGRKPRASAEETTVKELANFFLEAKQALVDSGELTQRSWNDYKAACDLLVSHFGRGRLVADLGPDDFADLRKKLARKWGPTTLGNTIQRIRVVLKYAADSRLIPAPVYYGQGFKRPSAKTLRLHKARQGVKLFTREEVHKLLGAAGPQLRAMILLAVNAGLGNANCGNLPLSALDLDGAVLDYPRPKTGLERRCALWPETVEAVKAALAARPEPKDPAHAGLVFLTRLGQPWARDNDPATITKEFTKLLRQLGINGHRNFYSLRHTHSTVADEARDQPAADRIMGHLVPHMSSVYRETISDGRLRAVAEHVRGWLFGAAAQAGTGTAGAAV